MKVLRRSWFVLALVVAATWAQDALVLVTCGRAWLSVTVPASVLGSHVADRDLTLGSGCGVTAANGAGYQLEHPLTDCGTTLELLRDIILYSNVLRYRPSAEGLVARARPFSIPINCSYPRTGSVSTRAIQPTWVPISSTIGHQRPLHFALDVYDSTWSSLLPHPTYLLGEMINIEASVSSDHHLHVKVFVDECVVSPRGAPWLRYKVVTDDGCLLDGQLGRSRFLPRRGDRSLRFQLDTFLFPNISRGQVYLHCHLKAVAEGAGSTSGKACSYDRVVAAWRSPDGANCSCCGSPTGCGGRRQRRLAGGRGLLGDASIHLGPLVLSALPSSSPAPTALPTTPEPSTAPPHHSLVPMVQGEKRGSGLALQFPGPTLAMVAMCSILAAVGITGCYCSVRRHHMGHPEMVPGESRDVAMGPTTAGDAQATTPGDLSSSAIA